MVMSTTLTDAQASTKETATRSSGATSASTTTITGPGDGEPSGLSVAVPFADARAVVLPGIGVPARAIVAGVLVAADSSEGLIVVLAGVESSEDPQAAMAGTRRTVATLRRTCTTRSSASARWTE